MTTLPHKRWMQSFGGQDGNDNEECEKSNNDEGLYPEDEPENHKDLEEIITSEAEVVRRAVDGEYGIE